MTETKLSDLIEQVELAIASEDSNRDTHASDLFEIDLHAVLACLRALNHHYWICDGRPAVVEVLKAHLRDAGIEVD